LALEQPVKTQKMNENGFLAQRQLHVKIHEVGVGEKQKDRKTDRQKDRQTERPKDRKTDRQKDRQTETKKLRTIFCI
jgi:hypothetical protein